MSCQQKKTATRNKLIIISLFAKVFLVAIPTNFTLNSHVSPLELAPALPITAYELGGEATATAK